MGIKSISSSSNYLLWFCFPVEKRTLANSLSCNHEWIQTLVIAPKNLKIEWLSSNILRTTMMITKLLIHLSYLQFNGNMNYNEIWIYDPTFIRNTRFEESPTRNSYSHMGLTRNPINRVLLEITLNYQSKPKNVNCLTRRL